MVQSWGVLLPESFLRSPFFAVLATFVAINTVMYLSLAIAKILPKVYVTDYLRGANRHRPPPPAPAPPRPPPPPPPPTAASTRTAHPEAQGTPGRSTARSAA